MKENPRIKAATEALEAAYFDAEMAGDNEAADRMSRALIVMETPAETNVFDDDFFSAYMKRKSKSSK